MRQLGLLSGLELPMGPLFHLSTIFILLQFPFPLEVGTNPPDQEILWNAGYTKYHKNKHKLSVLLTAGKESTFPQSLSSISEQEDLRRYIY